MRSANLQVVRLLLLIAGVMVLSIWLVGALNLDYFAGDPLVYYERTAELFSGVTPYLEGEFEHLPLMLVPMLGAWALGGSSGPMEFRGAWVLLTAVAILGLGVMFRVIDTDRRGTAVRWLIVSSPLMPLVLFRTEPWLLLPVVFAILSFLRGNRIGAGLGTLSGVLAKGWPLLFVWWAWSRRWRTWVVAVASVSVAALAAVALTPGFSSGRAFDGLHSESFGGALSGLVESVRGTGPRVFVAAGAVYVDAPSWVALVGVVGLAIIAWHLWRVGRARDEAMPLVLGALLAGAMLALPLQSTQFLWWLAPFVAFTRRISTLVGYMAICTAGAIGLATFEAVFSGSALWFGLVVVRNIGLFGVALAMAEEAGASN